MSEDHELAEIIRKSDHPYVAAERIYQLFGKRFRVVKDETDFTDGAYDPLDSDDEDEESETEETPAERRDRLRRLLAEADARERRRNGAPKRKAWTVDDLTAIAETICKSADPKTVVAKLAATEIDRGASLFTSYERSVMLTAVAKAQDRGGGPDDRVFSKFLQDPGNLLYRQWALLPADVAALRKRDSLLDALVAKTRAAGDGVGTRAAGGREAFAVGAGERGATRTEADALRDRIIANKRAGAPFMSEAALSRYADDMLAELERAARGKQERARPGTLERV
jgi:hypothetical protein